MTTPDTPQARLDAVRQRIRTACQKYGRDADSVNLLAVSKTKPVSDIEAVFDAGQRDFGENYLQEALTKVADIGRDPARGPDWHFIGAIQSNKTKPIAEHFDWVHTLASAKHARRLHDARSHELPPLKVLIQVNISNEPAKSGVAANDALALAESILQHERLELRGLMAIPQIEETPEAQRVHFRRLAELQAHIRDQLGQAAMQDLSMGMSADLEAAIAEGSTWLRIGTAIFGPRQKVPTE